MRIRPPKGLVLRTSRGMLDLTSIATVLGEVSFPERALVGGLEFEGLLRAVLFVENLGAFCDLPALDGWMFAHVAGWDTATVTRLFECLARVPVVHFGDLDPNGVRILQHIRGRIPGLRWFVPSFWEELIDTKGLSGPWPEDLDLGSAPRIVRALAARGMWLEQEPIVMDPRTPPALEAML